MRTSKSPASQIYSPVPPPQIDKNQEYKKRQSQQMHQEHHHETNKRDDIHHTGYTPWRRSHLVFTGVAILISLYQESILTVRGCGTSKNVTPVRSLLYGKASIFTTLSKRLPPFFIALLIGLNEKYINIVLTCIITAC